MGSEPGQAATAIFIRGIRTMNRQARAPLVIVDDAERDLSFLDAFPLENITVLKMLHPHLFMDERCQWCNYGNYKRGEAGRARISLTHEMGFLNRIGKNEKSGCI